MAEGLIRARVVKGIAMMAMARPPVNALGTPLRRALMDAIERFDADASVAAIVLMAEGPQFSAGADLREIGRPAQAPSLADLCDRIEACDTPVIVALQGAALGGGAELALAAHYRMALPTAVIGLPEVALGLLPGAGGTQRLPRLAGAAIALHMLSSGRPLDADRAQAVGLIDGIVTGELASAAFAFATKIAADGTPPRRAGTDRAQLIDGSAYMAAVTTARAQAGKSHARARIADCVEAALLLPPVAAMAFERAAWEDCLAHPQSRALRHVFLAERRISADQLTRDDSGARVPTPAGQAMIARLWNAQDRAIVAMVAAAEPEAAIDGAMVSYGFAAGPFGGTEALGGAGAGTLQRRVIAALMAEGARMVEEGLVARTGDVDALAVHGMGFPRDRGGPMMAAEIAGLLALRRDMGDWKNQDPVWAVPGLVDDAAVAGGFTALSEAQ